MIQHCTCLSLLSSLLASLSLHLQMKSRRQMCRCFLRAACSLPPSFGYVGVRVLLPFPFHGRFYDSRRTLLSPPFLMFSDYQKSVEMKAPKSRPDHRRNAAVGLKSFAAPELRMNLHSVVKLMPALQLSLMLCQKAMGVQGPTLSPTRFCSFRWFCLLAIG